MKGERGTASVLVLILSALILSTLVLAFRQLAMMQRLFVDEIRAIGVRSRVENELLSGLGSGDSIAGVSCLPSAEMPPLAFCFVRSTFRPDVPIRTLDGRLLADRSAFPRFRLEMSAPLSCTGGEADPGRTLGGRPLSTGSAQSASTCTEFSPAAGRMLAPNLELEALDIEESLEIFARGYVAITKLLVRGRFTLIAAGDVVVSELSVEPSGTLQIVSTTGRVEIEGVEGLGSAAVIGWNGVSVPPGWPSAPVTVSNTTPAVALGFRQE